MALDALAGSISHEIAFETQTPGVHSIGVESAVAQLGRVGGDTAFA
jgi:hypothetical protein